MNDKSLHYGLIAGIATVACFGLFYWIDKQLVINLWLWYGSLIIYIWAMYQASKAQFESKEGQEIPFKTALRAPFLVFVVANAIFYLFYYLLCNYIDPEVVEIQMQRLLESEFAKNLEGKDIDMSFSRLLFQYVQSLIGGFILSLAITGIVRRQA